MEGTSEECSGLEPSMELMDPMNRDGLINYPDIAPDTIKNEKTRARFNFIAHWVFNAGLGMTKTQAWCAKQLDVTRCTIGNYADRYRDMIRTEMDRDTPTDHLAKVVGELKRLSERLENLYDASESTVDPKSRNELKLAVAGEMRRLYADYAKLLKTAGIFREGKDITIYEIRESREWTEIMMATREFFIQLEGELGIKDLYDKWLAFCNGFEFRKSPENDPESLFADAIDVEGVDVGEGTGNGKE